MREIQNLNGVVEMVAGLFSRSVFRLKKSFKEKSITKCEEYNKLIDNNYHEMREILSQAKPPCLPYVGMFLTDLIFVNGIFFSFFFLSLFPFFLLLLLIIKTFFYYGKNIIHTNKHL